MNRVSIIGTGLMGRALVQTLAKHGKQLSIWNRTAEKAHALAQPGVSVANSFGEALEASPLIIFVLSDPSYAVSTAMLQKERAKIAGKTIVQLSSGTPQDARKLSDFVKEAGGMYIDGGILVHPPSIGDSQEAEILYSGNRTAFEALEPTLSLLSSPVFLGEDPGAAATLDLAVNVAITPTLVAYLQGLKICQSENFPTDKYISYSTKGLDDYLASKLEQAQKELPTNPAEIEETVALMAGFTKLLADYLKSLNIDAGMFDALARLYAGGVASGRGEHDSLCVVDLHAIS